MAKRLKIMALCAIAALLFASCSRPSVVGTWVEPAAEGSILGEVGFIMLENGGMVSINTGFREYKSWEQNGKQLIIKGMINGYNPQEFVDTLNIVTLNDTLMVVADKDGYSVTYQKK